MTNTSIYQDSFLVSGIMCHSGCGSTIRFSLANLNSSEENALLPDDAELTINADPQGLGLYRLSIRYCSADQYFQINKKKIGEAVRSRLHEMGFATPENEGDATESVSNKKYWLNLALSSLVILFILALTFFLPPSLPLTISLVTLSLLTAGFTARQYLVSFFRNLRFKRIDQMGAPVSLGWMLTMGHSIYHAVHMPLMTGFSMIFMNLIMPVGLMAIINGMDIIKNLIMKRSLSMQLKGLSSLFPQLADKYYACEPDSDELDSEEDFDNLPPHLRFRRYPTGRLKKQMLIRVPRGECFPVDGHIIYGATRVDASILTGEPQQNKSVRDFVPAGAINLGAEVLIRAQNDAWNSTVNKLLFNANRAFEEPKKNKSKAVFGYVYFGLIVLALVTAIAVPAGLGLLTVPLILQNIMGVLFAVCPCTIAIAHELPSLLSLFHRNQQGVTLRNKSLVNPSDKMHTIVFDKTGTLTTGLSQVDSFWGLSAHLWERIFLLEKKAGAEHPLARAIISFYESGKKKASLIRTVTQVSVDSLHRGLSGLVQGRSIQLGSLNYLRDLGIIFPDKWPDDVKTRLDQGLTPVYVAEDGVFRGLVFIRHQICPKVLNTLRHLKARGKRIIMLTGDNQAAARGFNQQHGHLFDVEDIYAEQTPEDKENRLRELLDADQSRAKGVWFVGDGLNDAPCARIVSEKGGVSCSMTAKDKAAFFTDLSLNGSIKYLFLHRKLNAFLEKTLFQNRGILVYSCLAFLAFLIAFSIAGISVSPIIPMVIMSVTTGLVIFNSYRNKWATDNAFAPKISLLRHFMASDLSLVMVLLATTLLIAGVLIATLMSGGLAFPVLVFTGSVAAIVAGACVFAASTILGVFFLAAIAWFITDKNLTETPPDESPEVRCLDTDLEPASPQETCEASTSQLSVSLSPEYPPHFELHEALTHSQ